MENATNAPNSIQVNLRFSYALEITPKPEGRKSKLGKKKEEEAPGPQKNMAFMQGLAEQAFNQSPEKGHTDGGRNEALTQKRMEVFDQ